jgi:drug/metabolite transporter (DMT)-like permease
MSSEVVFTAIVGIAFLGDPASWRFWTGAVAVLTSIVALNRLKAMAVPVVTTNGSDGAGLAEKGRSGD